MKEEKLKTVYDYLMSKGVVHSKRGFAKYLEYDYFNTTKAFKGNYPLDGIFKEILKKRSEISEEWLISSIGEMLKEESTLEPRNKIPFYDDETATIGGTNGVTANTGAGHPVEYIDTGDWFKGATAAIRHYGDSMIEYPPGCILALKEIQDKDLIVWGNDYVIETSEYRITKRVQRGEKEGCVLACSTNENTYKNGKMIHEPLDVPLDAAKFFLVLGYVVKKNGGTMVFSNSR